MVVFSAAAEAVGLTSTSLFCGNRTFSLERFGLLSRLFCTRTDLTAQLHTTDPRRTTW